MKQTAAAFVCSIDDSQQPSPAADTFETNGVRSEIMASYAIWGFWESIIRGRLPVLILQYGHLHPSTKRRIPVDVDETVARWVNAIAAFCMAHDKDALDQTEAAVEELLMPMLKAPVAQLREFYAKLVTALQEDKRIPFFAWRAFETWHLLVVKTAPDEEAKELKKDLASAIANLVEPDVNGDWHTAITDALMWRSEERLERMHAALTAAAAQPAETRPRARIRGRESCLFLQLETEAGKVDEIQL